MHLIIYFSGTGFIGERDDGEIKQFQVVGVSTISVRGCTHEDVCNSTLFPDLMEFAGRFVNSIFVKDSAGNLRLTSLIDENSGDLKAGIRDDGTAIEWDPDEGYLPITGITLCGTSRGGVTCFHVARELQKLAPDVKVDIVANQPAPGNISTAPGTTAAAIEDCTDLKNLQNVSVILGTYTEDSFTKESIQADIAKRIVIDTYNQIVMSENKIINIEGEENPQKTRAAHLRRKDAEVKLKEILADLKKEGFTESVIKKMEALETMAEKAGVKKSFKSALYSVGLDIASFIANLSNFVQRTFFSQIVPKVPKGADQQITVIPEVGHVGGFKHLQLGVAESLHRHGVVDVDADFVESKKEVIRESYAKSNKAFPLSSAVQEVFGVEPEGLYQYIDELHPQPNRRRGYEFEENQSLKDWWDTQEKKVSSSSTHVTKILAGIIESTNPNDKASLSKLYLACETWLVMKSGGISSRYDQVTALRNEVYDRLINQHEVPKKDLIKIKEKIHHEHKFLQKEWAHRSSYASFFQTTETSELDKAFKEHGKQPQSEANDRRLLTAMNQWLESKDRSVSKRYDLVLEMRNKLEESMHTRYPHPAGEEPGNDRPSISNSR